MRSLIFAGALAAAAAGASAGAQAPTAMEGCGAPGAEMLLAQTGELGLSDAQVTRLAAIARRSAARRAAMRATHDSIRARFTPGTRPDSAMRRQLVERMRADAQRVREQAHADRRDAIAVLTADQQARAWEMLSRRGGHRSAMRGSRGQRRGIGARPGRPGAPPMGARREYGPQNRRPIR